MQQLIDYIFRQYSGYQEVDIWLEIIAVIFGFLSVWYSKQNKILVFPTGMIVKRFDDDGFAHMDSDVLLYYGAADTCVCLAVSTVRELVDACYD